VEFSEVASKKVIHPAMWKKRPQRRAPNREGGRRMDREPVVVQESTREWETWPDEEVSRKGLVYWRTLISGEALHEHGHQQAEIYLILEGTGSVTIDGNARPVGAGSAVFIPGNVLHSCENTGTSELRFAYVLAADSFEEVEYVFDE
jgi:mannose-6-phosphate isomerase-like protein (cupin superfamily)